MWLLIVWCESRSASWFVFFFSSRRRHTRCSRDWSSDVCSSDLHPGARLGQHVQRVDELELRLRRALGSRLRQIGSRLELAARALNAVSPLATLERGFAIVAHGRDRKSTRLNSSHGYI